MIPGIVMDLATHILLLLCGYLSFKALRLAPTFLASRHNNIYDCIQRCGDTPQCDKPLRVTVGARVGSD